MEIQAVHTNALFKNLFWAIWAILYDPIELPFRNLRKCDRFWYESGNPLIRFTESQLAEVRKITLAKVCSLHHVKTLGEANYDEYENGDKKQNYFCDGPTHNEIVTDTRELSQHEEVQPRNEYRFCPKMLRKC